MIPEETIAQIRERVDIVALVGEYVRLSKSGASFKGLCPFHAEKSPSFYVHPQRRFFHCFGCQASGDVFSFLTRLEGLPFPEAASRLADKAGVEIPASDPAAEADRKRRRNREERLVEITDAAAGFFARALREHPLGGMARQVFEDRGLSQESVETFRLGYAPHSWDALGRFLREKGYSLEDAEAVGLVVPRRGSGHYDRFRHRLMFPICDHQGRIVAFSGRVLPAPPGEDEEREKGAKYINSPEGPLYTKGQVLFGLHEGRVETRRTGWCLLCEGNFDLVKLHQAGFANSVAPMGTALTSQQAGLLKRFATRVILLFDGDAAGRKAIRASYPLLTKAGLAASVVALPAGDDPDTFLSQHGSEALRMRVDSAPSIVEYLIDQGARESAGDPSLKAQAIEDLGPVLRAIDNPVETRLYVERIAQKFEVRDIDAVRQQLRRGLRRGRNPRERQKPQPAPRPVQAKRRAPPNPLELECLGAFIDQTGLIRAPIAERYEEVLTDPDLRAILQATSRLVGERGGLEGSALIAEMIDNSALAWLEGRIVQPMHEDEAGALRFLEEGLPRLEIKARQKAAEALQRQVFQARSNGDDELADQLTRQRLELLRGALKPV
ncbi:MAG: DNA primase [Polyangiales bacterium]